MGNPLTGFQVYYTRVKDDKSIKVRIISTGEHVYRGLAYFQKKRDTKNGAAREMLNRIYRNGYN